MADEVKSGYVHKCGKSVKSWKRRWFVLKQNGYLYYYTDSSAKVEKGKIDVVDAASVAPYTDESRGAERPPANLSAGNTFLIVTKERVFTCVCETLDERGSWLAALEKIRGVISADQQYPAPTYSKSPGQAPPIATPPAPPPYTAQPSYPPQTAAMPTPYTAFPPQPQPPHRPSPVAGPGYAGSQTFPPRHYQPPPPRPSVSGYPPPPQPAYRPAPQPSYHPFPPPVAYYPQQYPPRPPPVAYYPQQYPPRPPPVAYYPQQYRPAVAQPVMRQQHTTTVTMVTVPPPQQRVIIRR